ncbi:MAG: hypothetical protein ACRC57_05180 [Sarcina sp.]
MSTEIQNSYILYYNVWWGESVEITFNHTTMQINAVSKSGNFSSQNETYFTIDLIDLSIGKIIKSITASGVHTAPFVQAINLLPFKFGDIISITSTGVLREPVISNGNSTNLANCDNSWGKSLAVLIDGSGASPNYSCVNIPEYFSITPSGLQPYTPTITVNPLNILGRCSVTQATLSGTSYPNSCVIVTVNNNSFTGTTNSSGYFSIIISDSIGFTSLTKITISIAGFETIVYPSLLPDKNLLQETNSGFQFILNADENILTKPFNSNLYYARTLLSPQGQKAWDLAYSTLLLYSNINNEYPLDSNGNAVVYIDYSKDNILINSTEAEMIQKYLVRNCPRMFHLKDWPATPVYKDNVIIGQNFSIGNNAAAGNDYLTQLLETEEAVSYILSKIQNNMSIYQIIQIIQVYYEKMLSYEQVGNYEDMRGSFIAKTCVCGGYSKGFEYLLQRVGIENIWVQGFAGGGPHAWNFVDIYGKWYLSDTTWGGENWYLDGSDSNFTANHHVSNIYSVMPTLFPQSVPYSIGQLKQTNINLLGLVDYSLFNNYINISYRDTMKVNNSISLNFYNNGWRSTTLTKNNFEVWSANIFYPASSNTLYFYFTVNGTYTTTGNVSLNNLNTITLENGVTAAIAYLK